MLKRLTHWLRGPGVINRVANRPLLITPEAARDVLSVLMDRRGYAARFEAFDQDHDDDRPEPTAMDLRYQRKSGKTYHQAGAVAVIPVEGDLVHKYGTVDPDCGMTGYDGIAAKLQAALADPEIKGILLDINSPGGEVDGVADLAAQIAAASKPVWGIADAMAYSAAYWLGSQCDRLYMSATGGVGSIGVVMMHADFSEALANDGIKVTLIHAGAHKVDGNPYAPLPDAVRDTFQQECEELRTAFATAVATGRGLKVADVLATEARCMTAAQAIAGGFVDGTASSFDIVQIFTDALNAASATAAPPAATGIKAAAVPHPQKETSMEPKTGAAAPETAAAKVEGATEAKARIKAITGHAEAEGRETLAQHLAFDTDMSVDAAVAVLKSSEKRTKSPAGSRLGAAMSGERPAKVDADSDAGGEAVTGKKPLDASAIYRKRADAMGQTRH